MPLNPATLFQILAALAVSWGRMGAALLLSIAFAVVVGVAAGVNPLLEKIIIPVLDLLQSIPILSFFPLALYAFTIIHPIIGPELAALFLIFTSQAWNIAFGVYESMRVLPGELVEASRALGLGSTRKLLSLYLPAAFPKIVDNIPASWSNGLYFLVASEIITLGERQVTLFGIGSLSASFIASGRFLELGVSIVSVAAAVILTNAFFFLPLMRLSERYRFEYTAAEVPRVWMEKPIRPLVHAVQDLFSRLTLPGYRAFSKAFQSLSERLRTRLTHIWITLAVAGIAVAFYFLAFTRGAPNIQALMEGFERLGFSVFPMLGFSVARVLTAILLALGWTLPLALLVHSRRRLESIVIPFLQVGSSIPATLLAPLVMTLSADFGLPLEFGAVIIILLGIQWYLFFLIYGGLRAVPLEEEEVCAVFRIRGLRKLRHLYLPRLFPSLVTGLIVAMGGGWNTLIIAERLVIDGEIWEVEGPGIGKEISLAVSIGDVPLLVAATIWMAVFIVILNRFLWRRLYEVAVETVGGKVP